VFSGSVVVDHDNSSGFGAGALVAIYTSHDPAGILQRQALAFSSDRGRTWERYSGNPVLDIGSRDFRDPKVFRYGDAWVMAVVLAVERVVRFYRSPDLISWEPLSDFGPAGSIEGVWECPDLIRVPVEGSRDSAAWVLLVSVGDGAPAGGSGMQYFVGDFDGRVFTAVGEARWLDHGADFYAAVSYSGLRADEVVVQGWMSNWAYANEVPAADFRGSVTLPRRLRLRRSGSGLVLVQEPVAPALPDASFTLANAVVDGRVVINGDHRSCRVVAEFEAGAATRFGLEVRVGEGERTVVAVDGLAGSLSMDRSRSGVADFHRRFAAVHSAPLPAPLAVRLEVWVDVASVEVFAADGQVVLTDLVFPSPESTGLAVFAEGGPAVLRSLEIWPLGG